VDGFLDRIELKYASKSDVGHSVASSSDNSLTIDWVIEVNVWDTSEDAFAKANILRLLIMATPLLGLTSHPLASSIVNDSLEGFKVDVIQLWITLCISSTPDSKVRM
jgi:hypothetical protein